MDSQANSIELLEIKARIDDRDRILRIIASLNAIRSSLVVQDDTFFACRFGRLKLRTISSTSGTLIHYSREDVPGPKNSYCSIVHTSSPQALRETLEKALGTIGRVRKQRLNFSIGIAQVHLDTVDGLGDFVEIEVDASGDNGSRAPEVLRTLIEKLGISENDMIDRAYVDLLQES